MLATALVLIVIGWILHHWVQRRQFYRRDRLGNDIHGSYGGMLGARFIESIASFIGGAASLFGWLIVLFLALRYLGIFQ